LQRQIDSLIDAEYKADEPGGVILVAKNGEILHERAFGLANVELNVPMVENSVFAIASQTKQFTAVAALQQIEKGTLALTDTVGKFLPSFPPALKGITIEQLLTHTAGVPNPKSVASLLAVGRGWLSADQVTSAFKDQPLDFAPGTRWAYSNAGYQLLGYVIEKLTGEPFPEFMEKTILAPAGMTNSFWGNDMKIVPNRAASYLYLRNRLENSVNPNIQIAWAAGALQSTAEDLLKWNRALVAGKLISKATLQKAWTRGHLSNGKAVDYGYGWFVGELQGSSLVEHGGNMGGFMSHSMYFPREDLFVAVLLNHRGRRLPELVATDIAALALGRPLNIKPIVLSPERLLEYTGVFKDTTDSEVVISLENGRLFYQRKGNQKLPMSPYFKDKFFFENTSIIGEMNRDSSGRIVSFGLQSLTGTSKTVLTHVGPVPPSR
jgi:CubicO group peptidase (beta-lactamase class C family)